MRERFRLSFFSLSQPLTLVPQGKLEFRRMETTMICSTVSGGQDEKRPPVEPRSNTATFIIYRRIGRQFNIINRATNRYMMP